MSSTSRRRFLKHWGGALAALPSLASAAGKRRPRIAAIVTEYRENSHADVIVTKFLEGCKVLDFEFQARVQIASFYLDQVPENDLGRGMAARHQIPIFPSIEKALTLGGDKLAVDGVLLIGEHGNYPHNELGQHLYPRREFFEATAAVMRKSGRVVPVFNDKHLSYSWENAKWMWDTARELKIPFMAGSSIPVSWRKPDVQVPRGAELVEALSVGYGGVESYGFHTLEGLQCQIERRKGGERGVRSVQCLSGNAVWDAGDAGRWSWDLLRAALSRSEKPAVAGATRDEIRARCKEPEVFLIEHSDGLRSAALMLSGLCDEFLFAAKPREGEPVSLLFWLQDGKPFGHFARLSHHIQQMFLTGKPQYPVERTVLTTGVLDAAMQSRFKKGEKLATPHLSICYRL